MKRTTLFAFVIITTLSLFLAFGFWGFEEENNSWFQFPRNYKINNNYHNWANHEYGYNLMMSTEPNSIFMTEGGDNQVFSLLYFATAERKRPDIDFFDQKGNVFPRLYGDLLNTYPNELELIRNIRDFQLFSTGRPVYLTWMRENLDKLSITYIRSIKNKMLENVSPNEKFFLNNKYRLDTLDQVKTTARTMVASSIYDLSLRSGGNLADQDFKYLGPWYFKNFGMIFRVTPLRYAIVDALEILNGSGDFNTIVAEVQTLSKILMIPNQFDFYVSQLSQEGYVRKDGETVYLLKPFRGTFDHLTPIEHWDHYHFSYLDVPNAQYWDFLTREIFGNYIRMSDLSFSTEIQKLRRKMNYVTDSQERQNTINLINSLQDRITQFKQTIAVYNYDNSAMLYRYANELHGKNPTDAVPLYALTAQANYRYSENYLRATQILLDSLEKNPEKQQMFLDQARTYINEFYRSQEIKNNMSGGVKDKDWERNLQIAESLDKRIKGIKEVNMSVIKEKEEKAGDNIDQLKELSKLYQKRGDQDKTIETMQKIIKLEPNVYQYQMDLYQYTKENRVDIAYQTIDNMIDDYSNVTDNKPPIWQLHYHRGRILFKIVNEMIYRNTEEHQIKSTLLSSQDSFSTFLTEFMKNPISDNNEKQKVVIAETTLKEIGELLKKYP